MSELHTAALAYAKRGTAVFPLQPRGKEPALPLPDYGSVWQQDDRGDPGKASSGAVISGASRGNAGTIRRSEPTSRRRTQRRNPLEVTTDMGRTWRTLRAARPQEKR